MKGVSRGHPLPSTHIERRANSNQIGKPPQAEIPQIPQVPFPEFDCPYCGYKKKSLNRIFSCSLFLLPLSPSLCSSETRLHLFYSHIQLQKKALRSQISRQLFLVKAISLSIPPYLRRPKPLIILVALQRPVFFIHRGAPNTLSGLTEPSRGQQSLLSNCWLNSRQQSPAGTRPSRHKSALLTHIQTSNPPQPAQEEPPPCSTAWVVPSAAEKRHCGFVELL